MEGTRPDRDSGLIYGIDERPGALRTAILGFQHVLIMFTAMVGAPLAVARALGLPQAQAGGMLAGCMLGCGIGTILTSLGLGPLGGRLPLVLGIFAIFITLIIGIAQESGMAGAAGALVIGGVVTTIASPLLGRARALLPPVVLGTILLITGTSLLRVAARLLLRGSDAAAA